MERKQVTSSMIRSIGYEPESRTLEVEFCSSGAIYQYANVSPDKYKALMDAPSIGQHFARIIKTSHSYKKV